MSRESDLLFGLLALQMNFVSKDQLLECAAVWMGGSKRGLGDLLLEKGYLKDYHVAAVKALVDARLRDNDGDAGRSLASASVDRTVRDDLLGLRPPPDVTRSLAAIRPREPGSQAVIVAPPSGDRYRLGAEIARGGLGKVVEAFDAGLEREVAVKLVLDDLPAELAERFAREAKLTGRLDHPNIVPIYDFGTLAGGRKLFLSMKRIRGVELGKLLKAIAQGDRDARQAHSRARLLRVFQDICLGMAFAHDRGVIHRDLKPANVMIGDYGETLIVDWGLAREKGSGDQTRGPASGKRDSSANPELTVDGEVLGTPAYMSPEQASGEIQGIDHRSDIYSLGAILYEILTLRPPFEGRTVDEVISKVRSGRIAPPSRRVGNGERGNGERGNGERGSADAEQTVVRTPSVRPEVEAIPPELDAICVKALAFRKDDRYQTARELHDEVQLFLEGVKERERRQKEARERVESGRRWFGRYREMRGEIEAQEKAVREWSAKIRDHQPPAEKRPLWDAEARLQRLREERIEAFSKASAEFGQALTVDPGSAEASDGKCELFLDQFFEAEGRRSREEMLLSRNMMATCDRGRKYAARIDAPGRLTLRTFVYSCDCLRAVRNPEWRVEFSETATVPWRGGRPRPDLPLTDHDCPVPAITTFPEGIRWGHSGSCIRREVSGVEVSIAKYEDRDKRLVPGPERALGRTPLADIVLPRGSWLCVLRHPDFADVRLPVRIDRDCVWTQDVNLYRAGEIPEGFCYVPGGPFIFGGPWAGGGEAETRRTEDLFIARFPTTCADYLEFLNDLSAQGKAEEARRRQPREGDLKRWIEEGGRFRLPTPADDPNSAWDPRVPVFDICWFDAMAYCGWKSSRDGRIYRLIHDEEYEKAVRGVDGRVYSYGDEYDGTYSHTIHSLPGGMRPLPVDSFPTDESPCGIRGLSGGMATWCSNVVEAPFRDLRSLRGGAWGTNANVARAGYRRSVPPTYVFSLHGLRLAAAPVTF